MKFHFYIYLITFISLLGCERKEEKKEDLGFTEDSQDYTADKSDERHNPIKFIDVTKISGIDFEHVTGAFGEKWMPETLGSGGGFLDYDNDGWIDILLINSKEWEGHESGNSIPTSKLYHNKGDGTYEDVSVSAGITFSVYGMGSSFADFDADGDVDIFLTTIGDNLLLRNDNGKFTNIAEEIGVSGRTSKSESNSTWSTGSAWLDVNRDGWLDLIVANYVKWTPETDIYVTRDGKTKSYATPAVYEGESCRLYLNKNGVFFEDISEKAGILNRNGKSLGVAVADFNHDQWPDIVISNDTQPNYLYLNKGDGTFVNEAMAAGIGFDKNGRARAGMGIDVADIANNDRLAIVIGNFSKEPLSLYTQIGKGPLFQDRAGATQLTRPSILQLTFGVKFTDLDFDGYLDLVAANGHIEPEINAVEKSVFFEQKPQIFYNNKGKFIDISDQSGEVFKDPILGRGVATADIDNDGDNDILITVNGGNPKLLRNDTEKRGNYIRLKLIGRKPNLQAVGAKISVWSGNMKQEQMIRTGSSYLTQSDISMITFGLGQSEKADSIRIIWPTTGSISKLLNLAAGETHSISEGPDLP